MATTGLFSDWGLGHLCGASQTARPSKGIREIWVLTSTVPILSKVWASDLPSLRMGFCKGEMVKILPVTLYRALGC